MLIELKKSHGTKGIGILLVLFLTWTFFSLAGVGGGRGNDSRAAAGGENEVTATREPAFHAQAAGEFAGGSGTREDPFLVATEGHLVNVGAHPDKNFRQVADIRITAWNEGKGWEPIRDFSGQYDGNGFVINKLFINRPQEDNVGLFGALGEGAGLTQVYLEEAIVTGQHNVGGLAGSTAEGAGVNISYCFVSGHVTGSSNGDSMVGGLLGLLASGQVHGCHSNTTVTGHDVVGGLVGSNNRSDILDSHARGTVSGHNNTGGLVGKSSGLIQNCSANNPVHGNIRVGGLVGNNSGGKVTQCFAGGDVRASHGAMGGLLGYNSGSVFLSYATGDVHKETTTTRAYGGGLIGHNEGAVLISESYATGQVNLDKGSRNFAGGLIGWNEATTSFSVRDCYAVGKVISTGTSSAAGGLVALRDRDSSTIVSSYYDQDTTGQTDTTGGTPKTTTQMMQQETYAGWDFSNTWLMHDGQGYPELKWVNFEPVESVSLDTDSLTLKEGETRSLVATVLPENATDRTVRWSSSNEGAAVVDDKGRVTAVAPGKATIVVTTHDRGKEDKCEVIITPLYTVTFNSREGSEVPDLTLDFDSLVPEPDKPSREGFSFAGWYRTEELEEEWVFAQDRMPAEHITLYAKWIMEYTVIFKDYDGTQLKVVTVEEGSSASTPGEPAREGFIFIGWDRDFSQVTEDLEITAQYEIALDYFKRDLSSGWNTLSVPVKLREDKNTIGTMIDIAPGNKVEDMVELVYAYNSKNKK